ncbi:hypothetical protein [Cohnella soli]|uniref:Phage tail protein n=1 Tax=Cohnella soli TaxID=425005 RepID=A0ABW0HJY8_9BACL
MSMIFYLGYDDKAYLFSDTRMSAVHNGINYYLGDGFEKARAFRDKTIIFCMGRLDAARRLFEQLPCTDLDLNEIKRIATEIFKDYNGDELGVYVMTVDASGQYVIHTMASEDDFKIMTDTVKNMDMAGAGANSEKALDFASTKFGKMQPIEIVKESYRHVADEKVGGELIMYEIDASSNPNITIKRSSSTITDSRPLRRLRAHAMMDGTAKFRKMQLTDGNSTMLMDSETRKLYINNWDIEGVGALDARFMQTGTLTVADGYINDLTVTRLKTLDKSDSIGDTVDYLQAQDNYLKWVTGTITDRQQAKDANGTLLYWSDATKKQITTAATAFPFYNLTFSPVEKMSFFLEGEGLASYPKMILGTGDGVSPTSGKAIIEKPTTKLDITYHRSNSGAIRQVELADLGITIKADGGKIVIESTNDNVEIRGKNVNITASDTITFDASSKYDFK